MARANATKRRLIRGLLLVAISVALLSGLGWVGTRAIAAAYKGRILPGVTISGIAFGGMTPEEARTVLQRAVDDWNTRGVVIDAGGRRMTFTNTVTAVGDLDLTYDLIRFDLDATLQRAMDVGRGGDPVTTVLSEVRGFVRAVSVSPSVDVDEAKVMAALTENFHSLERPATDARFAVNDDGTVRIEPEAAGRQFDYRAAANEMTAAFTNFDHPTIVLALANTEPSIHAADLERVRPQAEALLSTLPRVFRVKRADEESASMLVPQATVASWLSVRNDPGGSAALDVDGGLGAWLEAAAKPYVQESQAARFTVNHDRVENFQASKPGWELNAADAVSKVRAALLSGAGGDITVNLDRVESPVSSGDANPFGIRELLGVGTSNFKGSPKNRRHNIATGIAKLDGIIIAAGEEFSLGKALGRIEEDTGYLPELVIKGDRTIPEFGGGLCQIGTTTFRVAMAAGLPILERQNHSYRVRYYEPAGTDATIYPPHPDLRFKNDTANAMVLITKMDGDDLRFELWGTSDQRKAERTDPKISNIVKPPEMKTVETEDLKPGEKKCTEIAHNGADTVFTYTVTTSDGTKREQVFKSHYKPWQAVCLVGVAKKAGEPSPASAEQKAASELPPPPDIPRVTP